jgi:hypothetical protein
MGEQQQLHSYVILQGGKQQYNNTTSRGCEGQLQGYGDDGPPLNNQIFYMLLSARSNDNEHISCWIAREAMTITLLML